jgi:hypothetical protein
MLYKKQKQPNICVKELLLPPQPIAGSMSIEEIITISSPGHFEEIVQHEEAVLIYFSHEECNVCRVLKPKVKTLLDMDFPRMKMAYADTVRSPEIAGQQRVFAVPTIVVYFGGREYIRVSRNIGVSSLGEQIRRPYAMLFDDQPGTPADRMEED